jgi:hypothetical protein
MTQYGIRAARRSTIEHDAKFAAGGLCAARSRRRAEMDADDDFTEAGMEAAFADMAPFAAASPEPAAAASSQHSTSQNADPTTATQAPVAPEAVARGVHWSAVQPGSEFRLAFEVGKPPKTFHARITLWRGKTTIGHQKPHFAIGRPLVDH